MKRWVFLIAFLLASSPAFAESIVADVSEHVINVTTGFTGADMIVFGTMETPSDVAIVVEGPPARATVRGKSRVLGIWTNTDSQVFDNVPGYYAIATSKPIDEMADANTLAANKLKLSDLKFSVRGGQAAETELFHKALLQRRQARGFYVEMPKDITVLSDKLFRATFHLPSNVAIGEYKVHVFLLHNGAITAIQTLPFKVDEVGLSAAVLETAKLHPLLYAGFALLMAVAMGGGGAWIFQKVS